MDLFSNSPKPTRSFSLPTSLSHHRHTRLHDMSHLVPFPRDLPWDVVVLVLEQADPSTLAVLGRVSLAFLEATASFLYGGEVVITSLQGLKQLFCEREEHETRPSSRITSFLSLSQIQTLSLDFASIDALPPSLPDSFTLSSSRISNNTSTLIPLKELNSSYHFQYIRFFYTFQRRLLFPWLNPARYTFHVLHRPSNQARARSIGDLPPLAHWTRLITVDVKGLVPWSREPGQRRARAGLLPPSLDDSPGRVVRLHLNSLCYDGAPETATSLVMNAHTVFCVDEMQEGSIVLVAGSKEEKSDAEGEVALFEPQSRRKTFKVVVE